MWIVSVVLLVSSFLNADPRPALTPASICASIDSNKYEAQCESAIRNKHFDAAALRICAAERGGYDIKSCMEVISNRTYTAQDLQTCLSGERIMLRMCLLRGGQVYVAPPPEASDAVPVAE